MKKVVLTAVLLGTVANVPLRLQAQMDAEAEPQKVGTGVLSNDDVQKLLPVSVYFKGQSAALQLRNAGAVRAADGSAYWASLVDTSGYSSSVREKYQFYLVTEHSLSFGGQTLKPGAYGAGFLNDGKWVVMDLGGHDLLTGTFTEDKALKRPRPLQMVAEGAGVRLYLGRQFVSLSLLP